MVFEHIRKLQQEYTDKFVVVDEHLSELQRFQGHTGQVKTVNLSGKALVEFAGSKNIGWYDIDLDFLKVIAQPLPDEPVEPKPAPAAKATLQATPQVAPKAKSQPAAPSAKSGTAEQSVDDILAAARGGAKPAAKTTKSKPKDGGAPGKSVADILAAARGNAPAAEKPAEPTAAKPPSDKGETSVSDILAAARGNAPAAEKPAEPTAAKPPSDKGEMSVSDILAAARGNAPAAEKPAEPTAAKPPSDKGEMSVSDILAAARGNAPAAEKPAEPTAAKPPSDKGEMSVSDILAAARGNAPAAEKPDADAIADSDDLLPEPPSDAEDDAKSSLPTDVAGIVAYCRRVDAK